jgi:uncharacterized membrane protein
MNAARTLVAVAILAVVVALAVAVAGALVYVATLQDRPAHLQPVALPSAVVRRG